MLFFEAFQSQQRFVRGCGIEIGPAKVFTSASLVTRSSSTTNVLLTH